MAKRLGRVSPALLALLAAAYVCLLGLDLFAGGGASALRFCCVALCFALALLGYGHRHSRRDWLLLAAALAFTLAADFLLLFRQNYTLGVAVFCVAHLLYIARYDPAAARRWLPLYAIGQIISLALFARRLLAAALLAQCLVYAPLLIANGIAAFRCKLPRISRRLASVGMALFWLCDINVALFNLLPQSAPLRGVCAAAIWLFYVPALALLALSGRRIERRSLTR